MDPRVSLKEPDSDKNVVVLLNRDLMLAVSITNTAKALGFTVDRVQSTTDLIERLDSGRESVALVIIDMNLDIAWDEVGEMMQSGQALPPVLGFGPHVDIDGRRAAKKAGLTRIVSNGEFHRDMAALITRYARSEP